MTVIYYAKVFFLDNVFPLIKEMQSQGINAHIYVCMMRNFKTSNILEFDKEYGRYGLYKASSLPEFQKYKDCVDLSRLHIISPYSTKWWFIPKWFVWIAAIISMLLKRADVFHIDWQQKDDESIVLKFPFAKKHIMTVHDPIQHTGVKNYDQEETARKRCFKWAHQFILLNDRQFTEFSTVYNIDPKRIHVSKLGILDVFARIKPTPQNIAYPYILFFGGIQEYKGLDILLEAMPIVHQKNPNIKLIIAGGGKLYFDDKPYRNLDYIEWRHRFIKADELVDLVRNAEFCVCPYRDATQSGVVITSFVFNTPVIVSDIPTLKNSIDEGVTGVSFMSEDIYDLAEKICDLYGESEKLQQMRYHIATEWHKQMSWTPIVKQYSNIYTGIIN